MSALQEFPSFFIQLNARQFILRMLLSSNFPS